MLPSYVLAPVFVSGLWRAFAATPGKMAVNAVVVDARKQGWHDKMAGTGVVRRRGAQPVRFG